MDPVRLIEAAPILAALAIAALWSLSAWLVKRKVDALEASDGEVRRAIEAFTVSQAGSHQRVEERLASNGERLAGVEARLPNGELEKLVRKVEDLAEAIARPPIRKQGRAKAK